VNKTTRRRRGINFFDLFVLLMVVAVLLVAAYFINGSKRITTGGGTPVTVTYSVEIKNLSEQVSKSAVIGSAVREGVRKASLGKVKRVEIVPMWYMKNDLETGEIKRVEVDGRYTATVVCEAQGELRGGRIVINEFTIGVGSEIALQSEGISGTGYCVALDYVETQQ
jgi:hypothetical protein